MHFISKGRQLFLSNASALGTFSELAKPKRRDTKVLGQSKGTEPAMSGDAHFCSNFDGKFFRIRFESPLHGLPHLILTFRRLS